MGSDETLFDVVSHENNPGTSEDGENYLSFSEVTSRNTSSTTLKESVDKDEAWEEMEVEKEEDSNQAAKDSWKMMGFTSSNEEQASSSDESSSLRSTRVEFSANNGHSLESTTKIVDETQKPSIAEGAAGTAFDPFGSTSSKERKSDSQASTAPFFYADENGIEVLTPQKRSYVNVTTSAPKNSPFDEGNFSMDDDSSRAASSLDDLNHSEKCDNSSMMNPDKKRTKTVTQDHPLREGKQVLKVGVVMGKDTAEDRRSEDLENLAYGSTRLMSRRVQSSGKNDDHFVRKGGETDVRMETVRRSVDITVLEDDEPHVSQVAPTYASIVANQGKSQSRQEKIDPMSSMDETSGKTGKKSGIFSTMIDAVCESIGLRQESTKSKLLNGLKDWKEKPETYIFAVRKFDNAAEIKGEDTVRPIIQNMECFLQSEDCEIHHLTLAAYVCIKTSSVETGELCRLILHRITRLILPSKNVGLYQLGTSTRFPYKVTKPHIVWYDFFSKLVEYKLFAPSEADDTLLVKLFRMWDDCGLLRRPYSLALWHNIRGIVGPGFFRRQSDKLIVFLGAPKANCLGSLLQQDLPRLTNFVLEIADSNRNLYVPLYHHSAHFMMVLVEQAFATNAVACHSIAEVFGMIFAMLEKVSFRGGKSHEDVIQCAVRAISFRSVQTFRHYDELAAAVGPDHKYARMLKESIETTLCDDLRLSKPNTSPGIDEVTRLLSSPTGHYLSSYQGVSAVKVFSVKAMKGGTPFHGKLSFLGHLHATFVSRQWVQNTRAFELHILDCIQFARNYVDSAVVLEQSFRVAKVSSSIFCCEEQGKAFLTRVSDLLCSDEECSAVLDKPALLQRLSFEETQTSTMTLHACLISRLRELLNCLDEGQTCHVVLATLAQEPSSRTHLASLGVEVFKTFFLRWNPQHLSDLIAFPSVSLRLLDEYFNLAAQSDWIHPEDRGQIKKCHGDMKRVVRGWLNRYRMEAMTKETLEQACSRDDESLWQLIEKIAGVALPSFSEMHAKRREFRILEESIAQLLRGSENESVVSIQRIFKGYHCVSDPCSALHRFLVEYDCLLTSDEPNSQTYQAESSSSGKELRQLREDSNSGSSFRDENSEYLSMCDYFLKNPSILFQSALFKHVDERLTLHTLVVAAKRAKETLVDGLGSGTSNYTDTSHAVKTVLAAESTVEHETSVLLGCSLLGLSPDDIGSFVVMAVLTEASGPLKHFVECCRQFRFAVAVNDPSFRELASIVQDMFHDSTRSLSVSECLNYSKRLCNVLGVESHLLNDDLAEIRRAIQNRIPILRLLGLFSCHSEVWTFPREMGWFGQKGLKHFYEQYANVTNVLLGNTASYEMSVLDAVEPTIRVVSAIGGLCQEAKLVDLINRIQRDKDVDAFLHSESGSADIGQVQTNLSQIRDWFTVGVDEIAAVHGIFDDVCKTGKYFLCSREAGPTNGLAPVTDNDSMESVLTRQYKTKRASPAKCCLQGEELAGFVQQIGLIQHENECTAASVNSFVEQYQVLTRAANNVISMRSIGFGEAGHDSFSCLVVGDSLTKARDLLLESKSSLRKCQSWLDVLRSTHFVSLLFLTGELLEIHRAIRRTVAAPVPTNKRNLTCILSRLARGTMSYQERFSITTEAIDSWKEPSGRTFSSWLVDVSMFLDSLHESFGAPWKMALNGSKERSQIVLHTLVCQSNALLPLSLRVLKHVYKVRMIGGATGFVRRISLFSTIYYLV
jgi:hypothetical protein